jgi:hypothetical protein
MNSYLLQATKAGRPDPAPLRGSADNIVGGLRFRSSLNKLDLEGITAQLDWHEPVVLAQQYFCTFNYNMSIAYIFLLSPRNRPATAALQDERRLCNPPSGSDIAWP